MSGRIIDCCSLINLYTGWGGLAELVDLPGSWYVGRAVCGEAEYVREYDAAGKVITITLNLDESFAVGRLSSLTAEEPRELADCVDFAMELDDGEAESLAMAKHRDLVLVTDDRKTLRMAQQVAVATISTAAILKEWGTLSAVNRKRLPEVLTRIQDLANFHPRPNSPDRAWWDSARQSV